MKIKKIIYHKIISPYNLIGIDVIKFVRFIKGLKLYYREFKELKKQLGPEFPFGKAYPILDERTEAGGIMKGHYFHQDLLVAQRIFVNKPERHIDVGSRVDGFVAHVAAFRQIEIFDIRDVESSIDNIRFSRADLMQLDQSLIESCDSISTLHAIEHFGLGRYGDPIDADGHLKAVANLSKMLKPGGKFYFSTPIGPQRIEFNAHRVFSVAYLLEMLESNGLSLDYFSYVDDKGDLFKNVDLTPERINNNSGVSYGCGIFELTKTKS